jgi:hypothetical protein
MFGYADARETQIAHEIAESERFNEEPVDLYNELLGKHGVESTGRIWSLACRLWDDAHEVKDS